MRPNTLNYILDKSQDRLTKQCNFRKSIELVEKLAITLRKEYFTIRINFNYSVQCDFKVYLYICVPLHLSVSK
jgi:hypothetical protein